MIYLIKLNIAIAIFYIAYRLLFSNDTFFRNRRATLIGAIILSALIPLTNTSTPVDMALKENAVTDIYVTRVLPVLTVTAGTDTATTSGSGTDIARMLLAAYLSLSILLVTRTAWCATTIARLARRSPCTTVDGIKVRLVEGSNTSFSFMKWIFADAATLRSAKAADVISHERTHAEQWHTADVLLGELMCAVCWPNPAAWLMRRQIKINLEYLADEHVLALGADTRTYQYHLLALSCPSEKNIAISNNFNVLPLKMRIKMMNKKRTAPQKRAKYLLLLPLAAILLAANNAETQARKIIQPAKTVIVANNKTTDDNDKTVYEASEVLPEFINNESGEKGTEALMKYLCDNVKYPLISMKSGVEGRVIVKFVVNTDGNVSDATIVGSASRNLSQKELDRIATYKRDGNEADDEPGVRIGDACNALDDEAIRVVSSTKWIPGKNKDKPVRVYFTLPINFKLQ